MEGGQQTNKGMTTGASGDAPLLPSEEQHTLPVGFDGAVLTVNELKRFVRKTNTGDLYVTRDHIDGNPCASVDVLWFDEASLQLMARLRFDTSNPMHKLSSVLVVRDIYTTTSAEYTVHKYETDDGNVFSYTLTGLSLIPAPACNTYRRVL